ncbi:hypothetical protein K470DRAFT_221344 [Piedraia hortae CBS 480.64]|uniref:Uncharacterized protein n=1 Tax=Piedraia hortae CBS 480.64 TaxID=1314780 RepID=A0A6A7BSY3_9PEZI|nr:hypothetical protein K470DRAFT_221344 [Piedraia hortae CBS 480.64]
MARFNEAHPLQHRGSMSSFGSVPSTPTSTRSRSTSISSLDTIADAPDLESEAAEAERIERLQKATEKLVEQSQSERAIIDDVGRRSSLDAPRSASWSLSRASRERKRWSVCGGERGLLEDLETIWED